VTTSLIEEMKDRSKVGMGVALLSIAAATTVLQRNPAPGILPSLYYGVPSYVWFLLILPIVLSAIIGLTDTSSRWLCVQYRWSRDECSLLITSHSDRFAERSR